MYSLAIVRQELSICWRCQCSLLNRDTLHKSTRLRITKLPRSRSIVSQPPLYRQQRALYADGFNDAISDATSVFDRSRGGDQIVFTPKAVGPKWRRLRLGEQTISLDMNVLGQPAQIRILQERVIKEKATHSDAGPPKYSENTTSEDLMRTMATEAAPIDFSAVKQNIEELHTSFLDRGGIVDSPSLSQCAEMAQTLHDGFTTSQLTAYLKEKCSKLDIVGTTNYDHLEARFHSKMCTRSAWFSGTSNFPEEAIARLDPGVAVKRQHAFLIGLLPPQGHEKQTEKQQVVERVLRQAWRIRCKEEKVLEGELDMRVQAEHLELLLNHRMDIFKKLSDQYGAKLDISKSQHIIRITGDYTTCSDLSKFVYVMIEKIRSADIELPPAPESSLRYKDSSLAMARSILKDKSYVQRIEMLTNTLIKSTLSTQANYINKLRVYYIGPDDSDLDDVHRLVRQVLEPENTGEIQVQIGSSATHMIPVQIPVEVGSAVPWTERGTSWIRWSDENKPKFRRNNVASLKGRTKSSPIYDPQLSREIAEASGFFLSEKRSAHGGKSILQDDNAFWQPAPSITVYAVLGHIVYPALSRRAQQNQIQARTYKLKHSQDRSLRNAFLKAANSRHIMLTSLPKMVNSLEHLAIPTRGVCHELLVRLKPSKAANITQLDMKSLPDLVLRVKLHNSTKTTEISSIQLVRDERASDLLLPREVADIRFCAYTSVKPNSKVDPAIKHFCKDSNFDVWGEERLKTPSKLELRVPEQAMREDVRHHAGATGGVDVEYTFTNMEHQSYMTMLYQGFPIIYTTIEAGKTGGRRTELRFDAPMDAPHSKSYVTEDFVPFFDTVRDFVAMMGLRDTSSLADDIDS